MAVQVETKMLEGRAHWVAPVVLITEGVWSGSEGPVYYSADVLKASARAWNAKPVVVYHPAMYGGAWADSPEVFNRQKIGTLFNTRFEGGRLKAEAWLDKERLAAVDFRVAAAIAKCQPIEISTGVGVVRSDTTNANGAIIALELLPDHLAVLPDQKGACSLADGAGLLVNRHFEAPLRTAALFC